MNPIIFTAKETDALLGRLSKAEWDDIGMGLFVKGVTNFDPLTGEFSLTETGKAAAINLRQALATGENRGPTHDHP